MSDRYSPYEFLDVVVSDRVATITLNRPEALNAVGREAHGEVAGVLRTVNADPEVNAIVLAGAGRAFSVGGDLALMEQMCESPETVFQILQEARELVQSHIDCTKPVVAAVQGVAMGAGLTFALLADFVIVEQSTRLADGHIRAALSAGDGGAIIWPLTMGLTKAKRYLLTGDWIEAVEAERLGLVTEVVPDGQCLQRATAIAHRLADGPQAAIRTTKMALNQWLRLGQLASFDFSIALEMVSASQADFPRALEGVKRREPAIAPE